MLIGQEETPQVQEPYTPSRDRMVLAWVFGTLSFLLWSFVIYEVFKLLF